MEAVQNDFSKGSIVKNIINLAVPMTLAQLINVLYNVVDRIYIGRIPGAGSLPGFFQHPGCFSRTGRSQNPSDHLLLLQTEKQGLQLLTSPGPTLFSISISLFFG